MSTIPELRPRLLYLAMRLEELGMEEFAQELRWIEMQLHRRPATRRAPPKSRIVTDALARRIREFARAHPQFTYQEIGTHFQVGAGRISEIVAGKRT